MNDTRKIPPPTIHQDYTLLLKPGISSNFNSPTTIIPYYYCHLQSTSSYQIKQQHPYQSRKAMKSAGKQGMERAGTQLLFFMDGGIDWLSRKEAGRLDWRRCGTSKEKARLTRPYTRDAIRHVEPWKQQTPRPASSVRDGRSGPAEHQSPYHGPPTPPSMCVR